MHEYPATENQALYVEIESGAVTVTASGTDRVEVELTGAGADDVSVQQDGDRVTVLGPRSRGFTRTRSVHVRITTPTGSDLVTKLGSASVEGTGMLGTVRVSTGSGSVTLDEVDGHAVVRTGSGDIGLRRIGAEADLQSGSGDIAVGELVGTSRLATGSGDIVVDHAEGAVSAKSGSGDLRVDEAGSRTSLASASGDLEVRRMAAGQAQLKNVSGDIRLGIPAGTPVWTDISTATGHVKSGLTPTGAPTEGQPYVEVTAKTVTGDVYLDQL
ncbi:MAG TPA: DUF4097 family beta strand repeat-containing protein [Marmoricola sp.]|nr:DUF4097 family beta strand repeat-containing protein [Marmoricola sp.]